ncbi:chalcone isomerase family protein [Aureibacter tunicatorum]|uniref:Chalcone isomerase domain-containing protein n=1 Tax=Aureibacter tunicatorum TaxID=866807 RepID=A0AAE3XII9_9BACT|nr:chalcone isomerase family protein [Aureibacter tunicatorum]MDR6238371.1 hypothetical protein [Aureibacter tunicatorum]BDD03403.1 chalcone isomerase [Aureibacter tunicatorum]
MKKIVLFFFLSVVTVMSGFAQRTVSGVELPESIVSIKGKTLQLNGAGVREKFWIKLYVGSLYTQVVTDEPHTIINEDEPMSIRLNIISSLITADKMMSAIKDGFELSAPKPSTELKTKITEFENLFKTMKIEEGDEISFEYVPYEGTKVTRNGELVKTIEGLDFKKALYGIWLGKNPADKKLKNAMLGKAK